MALLLKRKLAERISVKSLMAVVNNLSNVRICYVITQGILSGNYIAKKPILCSFNNPSNNIYLVKIDCFSGQP